jgi:hypothetical protein
MVSGRDSIGFKRCRLLCKVVKVWQGWGEGKGFPEPFEAQCLRATGHIPYPSSLAPFLVVADENWDPLGSVARGKVFWCAVEENGRFKRIKMESFHVSRGGKGKCCCMLWWAAKQTRSGGDEPS